MLPGGAASEVVTRDNDGEFAFCPVFTGAGDIPVGESRLGGWYSREGILPVHFSLFGLFQAVAHMGSGNNAVGIHILALDNGSASHGVSVEHYATCASAEN